MFEIIGVQRDEKRVLVGTPKNAGEALKEYRAAQNVFPQVIVLAPDGSEVDGFELSRRYLKDESDRCA